MKKILESAVDHAGLLKVAAENGYVITYWKVPL